MPLTKFICPDGVAIEVTACFLKCRMGRRCLTLPTLKAIFLSERVWEGVPSTTQLMNGTMMEWLKITQPYAGKPQGRAYSLLGQEHHAHLATMPAPALQEFKLDQGNISGIFDLLEPDEENPGAFVLTDYKTYGSYRVQKCLGLVKNKDTKQWEIHPEQIEMWDEEHQLNHYRVLLQDQGVRVTRMQIQVTVRDGGLQVANMRGVTEPIYLIEVKRLPDDEIKAYFANKRDKLLTYLAADEMPKEPCDDREAWEGRRCTDYCEVWMYCPRGKIEKFKQATGGKK